MFELSRIDSHIHVETKEMTPYAALELIREKGLKAALVDHVFSDRDRITPFSVKGDCRKKFPDVEFIHGCEVDVYGDGSIALPEKLISVMDFIMLSFTHIGQPGVIDENELKDMKKLAAKMLHLFEAAVAWPHIDVIAHPFALPLNMAQTNEFIKALDQDGMRGILVEAARRGIIIEINARTLRRMSLDPQKLFLQAATRAKCLFTISSDAHTLEEIGKTKEALDIINEFKILGGSIMAPASFKNLKNVNNRK